MWLLALAAGCAVPRLDAVAPSVVRPGAELKVSGALLELTEGVVLTAAAGGSRSVAWAAAAPDAATWIVPLELPSGVWAVSLQYDGWRSPKGVGQVEVWRPETEPPCQRRFALKVHTERRKRRVEIAHHFESGDVEESVFEAGELAALVARGTPECTQVFLETRNHGTWLLADGAGDLTMLQGRGLSEALEVELRDERAP
jgi:hypothetical protein